MPPPPPGPARPPGRWPEITGDNVTAGSFNRSSTTNVAMLAHTPAAQAWASCRSTNNTGPARRRSRHRIVPQAIRPTVQSTR